MTLFIKREVTNKYYDDIKRSGTFKQNIFPPLLQTKESAAAERNTKQGWEKIEEM
jgi:hypothetical protein